MDGVARDISGSLRQKENYSDVRVGACPNTCWHRQYWVHSIVRQRQVADGVTRLISGCAALRPAAFEDSTCSPGHLAQVQGTGRPAPASCRNQKPRQREAGEPSEGRGVAAVTFAASRLPASVLCARERSCVSQPSHTPVALSALVCDYANR
ncbi:hypothetical protein SKAU_G00111510 [Synaphobranchus kaupii]|uniref:Uncharacterized protein n=1 Tax=Synaphobranchus kaupii TaxID=118154 RepID=A0A9Q1G0C9_SYNKA|nr:hypothetical protein SKAU_G00111510 [Synaphobranchus kaupii]